MSKDFDKILFEASKQADMELKNNIEFSEQYKKRKQEIIEMDKKMHRASVPKRRVFVFVAAALVIFGATFGANAWKIREVGLSVVNGGKNSDIHIDDVTRFYSDKNISVSNLPPGFTLTEDKSKDNDSDLKFEYENDYFIIQTFHTDEEAYYAENAKKKQKIKIGKEIWKYSKTDTENILIKNSGTKMYIIKGNIEKKMLIYIAKGVL